MLYEGTAKATDRAEGADAEMEFQSAYLTAVTIVDTRITAKNPYTAAEALELSGVPQPTPISLAQPS